MIAVIAYFIIISFDSLIFADSGFINKSQRWKPVLYKPFQISCSYYFNYKNHKNIIWVQGFKPLNESTFKIVEENISCTVDRLLQQCVRSTLFFTPFCDNHSGIYKCYLVSEKHQNQFLQYPRQELHVFVDARFWDKATIDITIPNDVCINSDVTISCTVKSDIPPSSIWIKKSKTILKSVERVKKNDSCEITIEPVSVSLLNVQESDVGQYFCVASHPHQSNIRQKKSVLIVNQCSVTAKKKFLFVGLAITICVFVIGFCAIRIRHLNQTKLKCSFKQISINIINFYSNDIFDYSTLKLMKTLGEGQFGIVYLGKVFSKDRCKLQNVAVKILKYDSTDTEIEDFDHELNVMKYMGSHTNVIQYLGCDNHQGKFRIIMEYASNGSLLHLLKKETFRLRSLNEDILIKFAIDAASGMEYLSNLKLVHRDLAARNILVTDDWTLKVADFGLTRCVSDYYRQISQGKVPLRWLAIESILYKVYTTMSDVWSFGILMWEIFSLGRIPYPDVLDVTTLSAQITVGKRNSKPEYASDQIFGIMENTWMVSPQERPTFTEILHALQLEKTFGAVDHLYVIK